MKKLMLMAMALVACVFAHAQKVLPNGTIVNVQITSDVDSKCNPNATGVVLTDVTSNGMVFIKAGTPVDIQVDRVKAKGCGRAGQLNLKAVSTKAVDGQMVGLVGRNFFVEGDGREPLSVGLAVGLGLIFPPFVAFLAIKGKQAVIKNGTILPDVKVSGEVVLHE